MLMLFYRTVVIMDVGKLYSFVNVLVKCYQNVEISTAAIVQLMLVISHISFALQPVLQLVPINKVLRGVVAAYL